METKKKTIENLEKDIRDLRNALMYLLDIKNRQHQDDYAYDDGWERARKVLEKTANSVRVGGDCFGWYSDVCVDCKPHRCGRSVACKKETISIMRGG